MGLFEIDTDFRTPQDVPVRFPFETPDYPGTEDGLTALRADLNDGLLIQGHRLKVERRGNQRFEVERDPVVLGRKAVKMIKLMNPDKIVRMR